MGFQVSRWMAASPDAVFEACADFAGAAQRVDAIEQVEMLTDGPVGVGTRFLETRTMFGKAATEEMEVTQFEPGKSYTLEADSCGSHFVSRLDFVPEGEGCRVTMDMQARPLTLMAKLMSPMCWFMGGMMKRCLEQDLADVERHLGATPAPLGGSGLIS